MDAYKVSETECQYCGSHEQIFDSKKLEYVCEECFHNEHRLISEEIIENQD